MKKRSLITVIAILLVFVMPLSSFAQAKKGARNDVNLALQGVVSTLDPFKSSLLVDLMLYQQIYESFYFIDDYGKPHSRLALSHTISPDGLVYTFRMRKDAYFHNGDPVKASDAVFSFKTAMTSPVMDPYVNVIKDVRNTDDYTVEIVLKQPYTPFLNNSAQICIVSEKAYAKAGQTFGATITGAGTGPYKVVKYDSNTKIELEAFPKYYRGEASIKKVTFYPMSDTSTGLIAFENGELDFYTIPTPNWKEITESGKYSYTLAPSSHISYILLNPSSGVLKNQDLRYAINYAVDRDAINLAAYEGYADVAYHMMRPGYIFGASEDTFKFSYDPAKVKDYLRKAGYPNGVDIGVLEYTTATYFPKIAQTFQAQLAEFGIRLQLKGGDTSALVGNWRAGKFNMLCSGFAAVLDYDYYSRYTSPEVASSFLKFQNTDYNAAWIVEQYHAGAAELNEAKRAKIYYDLEEYIARTACYIPIFYKTSPSAWNKNLNVKLGLNYYYVYDWSWK